MNRALIGLVSLATTLGSAPLLAAAVDPLPAMAVSTAGLDLASTAGQQAARARIAVAVRSVCGDDSGYDLNERKEIRRCRTVARNGAEQQLQTRIARADTRGGIMVASLKR